MLLTSISGRSSFVISRRKRSRVRQIGIPFALASIMSFGHATAAEGFSPSVSLVLDGAYKSDELALNAREKGFELGHTELSISDYIDDLFFGQATGVVHDHEGETEFELEEAFVETLALPGGFQLRGGRFLSQVGYLNGQHPHADDFAERPLLYRAFLGGHYFDDGVRANWVLPTPIYWRIGAEAFSGGQLAGDSDVDRDVGVLTVSSKLGGDIGDSHSWQLGVSYLRNRLIDSGGHDHNDGHDHDHDHDHGHGHAHGARFMGENLYLADVVWKWAPGGNNRQQQLRLSAEYAYVTDLNDYATDDDVHQAWYASAAYRFHPQWEVGLRYGELDVSEPHGDHFHDGSLRESNLMLAWKHSHFSTLRLQYTHQHDRGGFADAGDAVTLQYVMSLGDHDAHAY